MVDANPRIALAGNAAGLAAVTARLSSQDFAVRTLAAGPEMSRPGLPADSALVLAYGPAQRSMAACRQLLDNGELPPIIVYLQSSDPFEEALALEMGADEVLHHDMSPQVMASRLRALLRRCARPPALPLDTLGFGRLSINASTQLVTFDQDIVGMPSSEFELLWLLASKAGQVVSRDEVQRQLRGFCPESTRAIDTRLYRLQARLVSYCSDAKRRIRTVRPNGYIFANLAW